MRKRLVIVVGIVLVLITVGLSGCMGPAEVAGPFSGHSGVTVEVSGDTDKIELVSYALSTEYISDRGSNNRKFQGKIKNIADETLLVGIGFTCINDEEHEFTINDFRRNKDYEYEVDLSPTLEPSETYEFEIIIPYSYVGTDRYILHYTGVIRIIKLELQVYPPQE